MLELLNKSKFFNLLESMPDVLNSVIESLSVEKLKELVNETKLKNSISKICKYKLGRSFTIKLKNFWLEKYDFLKNTDSFQVLINIYKWLKNLKENPEVPSKNTRISNKNSKEEKVYTKDERLRWLKNHISYTKDLLQRKCNLNIMFDRLWSFIDGIIIRPGRHDKSIWALTIPSLETYLSTKDLNEKDVCNILEKIINTYQGCYKNDSKVYQKMFGIPLDPVEYFSVTCNYQEKYFYVLPEEFKQCFFKMRSFKQKDFRPYIIDKNGTDLIYENSWEVVDVLNLKKKSVKERKPRVKKERIDWKEVFGFNENITIDEIKQIFLEKLKDVEPESEMFFNLNDCYDKALQYFADSNFVLRSA
jgi:hypothetical protein